MEKRYRIDFTLLGSVFFIVLIGILTLYSQESVLEDGGEGRWFRQLLFFLFSLPLLFLIRRSNYAILGDYAIHTYLFAIFLLLLTLAIGTEVNGAKSWLRIPGVPLGFQPSELAKLASIILLARYLEYKEKDIYRIPTLVFAFAIVIFPMLLIVVQPDLGSALALAPILLSMLFIAGADIYHVGSVVIFFSASLSIPLYIEYHKITLWEPLVVQLTDRNQSSLAAAVRALKRDVWDFVDHGSIPASLSKSQESLQLVQNVQENQSLMAALRDASNYVRHEGGGLILRILENETFIIIFGVVITLIALVLFVVRLTQGNTMAHLRRFYIPFGVIGISLLAASAVQLTFTIKYYQVVRITAFINPERFPRDEAYHIRASKAAIGSGELMGRGVFNGDMTVGERPLVPEAPTDFIFTSWGERTGFLGSAFLLLLLVSIPLRGLLISYESRDRFGALLAAGISSMLFYHIVLNAGIALGLLPVTGLPMSFMSYGGSHLLICMFSVGILLSVYRRRFAN